MCGIASFLVAQVLFAVLFSLDYDGDRVHFGVPFSLISMLPFAVIIIISISLIIFAGKIPSVIIPAIIVYGLAISAMGWRALAKVESPNGKIRVIGSFIFIASDLSIAINVFTNFFQKMKMSGTLIGIWIMVTYWIALYCFAYSFQDYTGEASNLQNVNSVPSIVAIQ